MPKLPKKKSLRKKRPVPYVVPTIPLTRSQETTFSDLQELDELRRALQEDDTTQRRTIVTRQMTNSEENTSEFETILNSPKVQNYVQEKLALNSPKANVKSKRSTEPKPIKTSTKENVNRKRSVSSSVGKSPKKVNLCIDTENQNSEFGREECSSNLNENVVDQNLNNLEILRGTVTDLLPIAEIETENNEIVMSEERRNAEKDLSDDSHPVSETGEALNDTPPALEQTPMEQNSEMNSQTETIRSGSIFETENVHQKAEGESHCNTWYFTKFVGSVVQTTSSFFHDFF